jgi:hypothetical protein
MVLLELDQQPGLDEVERTGYRAALSVVCLDAVRGTVVADDVVVSAWRATAPTERLSATRSPQSGIQGFGLLPAALPGLPRTQVAVADHGAGLVFPSPALPDPWVVSVMDRQRRYLPVLARVDVPVAAPFPVDLHAAVTRPVTSGWALIKGDVRRRMDDSPIAWPVVTVLADQTPYDVIADALGQFLLVVPYPEALPPLNGSPPLGPGLSAMTWPLTITVRSSPDVLAAAPGSDWGDPASADPPELGSILAQQPAQQDVGGVLRADLVETLHFGSPSRVSLSVQPN